MRYGPQVCIDLVVTEEGFPLGYEVYAWITHDSTIVPTIIEALEQKHWVFDRGMVSEANLKYLRERGGK